MSIMTLSSTIQQPPPKPPSFEPTIFGRIDANGYVVYASDTDFALSPGTASALDSAGLWVIQTATDCFIRVGRATNGDGDQWYDTGGTGQGDPGIYTGTGATVFQLNEQCDTVNIYNKQDTSTTGTPDFYAMGSYTSDDKGTFFAPTQDTKYGRRVEAVAFQSGLGVDTEDGQTTIQVTFRKAGLDDYTITFRGRARAQASVDI